jgi:hypothetical protein
LNPYFWWNAAACRSMVSTSTACDPILSAGPGQRPRASSTRFSPHDYYDNWCDHVQPSEVQNGSDRTPCSRRSQWGRCGLLRRTVLNGCDGRERLPDRLGLGRRGRQSTSIMRGSHTWLHGGAGRQRSVERRPSSAHRPDSAPSRATVRRRCSDAISVTPRFS